MALWMDDVILPCGLIAYIFGQMWQATPSGSSGKSKRICPGCGAEQHLGKKDSKDSALCKHCVKVLN